MDICVRCHQKFNQGFHLAVGPVCAHCIGSEKPEELSAEEQVSVERWREKYSWFGGETETAKSLASRLSRALLTAIFVPLGLELILLGVTFGLDWAMTATLPDFPSVIFEMILLGGTVVISFVAIALHFRWIYIVNDALEATDNRRILTWTILSFLVPLVGWFVSLKTRSRLLADPGRNVSYGRLRIV